MNYLMHLGMSKNCVKSINCTYYKSAVYAKEKKCNFTYRCQLIRNGDNIFTIILTLIINMITHTYKKDRSTNNLKVYASNSKVFSNILGFHILNASIAIMAKLAITSIKSKVVAFYHSASNARKSTATSRYNVSKKKRRVIKLDIVIFFALSDVFMVL